MIPTWRPSHALVLWIVTCLIAAPAAFAQSGQEGQPAAPAQDTPPVTRPGPPFTLASGYGVTKLAGGMGFLTGLTLDDAGNVYVVTNGCPYIDGPAFAGNKSADLAQKFGYGEVIKVGPDGSQTVLASEKTGGVKCSLNGITWHAGKLYVAGLGEIDEVDPNSGASRVILSNLPWGDHYVAQVAFGPDGKAYFGIGTATNAGVVGADDNGCCWKLSDFPDKHEVLPYDVTLTGVNFSGPDCTVDNKGNQLVPGETGALVPYGTATSAGQVIRGSKKANTTVNRFDPSDPEGTYEVYASGFRHPYSLAFNPAGKLYVVDNGPDIRGCRPIGNGVPDNMWEVNQGDWMGWPEVFSGYELDNPGLSRLDGTQPPSIFTRESRPAAPKTPFLSFVPHTSASGIAFSTSDAFGFNGDAFVTEFGSLDPGTTGGPVVNTGKKILRIDMNSRQERDFFVSNDWGSDSSTIRRPLGIEFSKDGSKMYVADFGLFEDTVKGPVPGYGAVWIIQKGAGTSAAAGPPQRPTVAGTAVTIADNRDNPAAWGFQPTPVNVKVGDTVTWVNAGIQPHTSTSTAEVWDTELIEPGGSASFTFTVSGTYEYFCEPHPWMRGQVVVSSP